MSLMDEIRAWTTKVDPKDNKVKQYLNVIMDELVANLIPSGLTKEGRVSFVTINENSWTKLPSTPLEDRNNISIQNRTGKTFYLTYVDGLGISKGYELDDQADFQLDIKNSIEIYGRSKTGDGSLSVTLMEIA